jgi:hypothetical protein
MVTGTSLLVYQNLNTKEVHQYSGPDSGWLGGLAFRQLAWHKRKFKDITPGTDTQWLTQFSAKEKLDLGDGSLFFAGMHSANTCRKDLHGREWSQLPDLPECWA